MVLTRFGFARFVGRSPEFIKSLNGSAERFRTSGGIAESANEAELFIGVICVICGCHPPGKKNAATLTSRHFAYALVIFSRSGTAKDCAENAATPTARVAVTTVSVTTGLLVALGVALLETTTKGLRTSFLPVV